MEVPIEEFFNSINNDPRLVAEYNSKLNAGIKAIKSQFRRDKKERKKNLQEEIDQYEEHDALVNMIIFPFVQKSKLTTKMGYKLIACDPLYELDIQNFDVMVARVTNKGTFTIWIEAKTTSKHFKSIVNETINKQKLCEDHGYYIRKTYFESDKSIIFEYVICTYSRFVDKLQDEIEQKFSEPNDDIDKRKIIVWKADQWDSLLSIANPGEKNSYQRRMLHEDGNLNSELGKELETSKRNLSFFPQSHIVTKIKGIVEMVVRIKISTGKTEFDQGNLNDYFCNTLFYLKDEQRQKILSYTLEIGKRIGLITDVCNGVYSIAKSYSGSSLRPQTVEKLWIEFKINQDMTNRIETFTSDLRSKIQMDYETTPKLDDYISK